MHRLSTTTTLLLALLLCAAYTTVAVALDCSRHCYSGSLEFASPGGGGANTAPFSFGIVPCSQTVDGHVDQVSLVAFSCDTDANGTMYLTVQTASGALPFYQLQWHYNTTDSCATALANGLEFPAEAFVGTAHISLSVSGEQEPTSSTASSGALSALEAVCGQDCGNRCYNVHMLANYVPVADETGVGEGSPCGVAGTQQCSLTLSFTVQPCTGYLSALELRVGAEGTQLSLFDPAQLANAQFDCTGDGQLRLDAAGLYVLWRPTGQPCATLLDSLNTLATGGVAQVAVIVGHDTWQNDVDQGAASSPALSVCQAVQTADNDTQDVDALSAVPVRKRILPFVTCSHQIEQDRCCTVFGYFNPNWENVVMPRRRGSNWFTPPPVNRGQTLTFIGNSTVEEAFAILWPCNKYERHVLTWSLKHPRLGHDLEQSWFRQARAVRTRNDCSAAQREDWCLQLQ